MPHAFALPESGQYEWPTVDDLEERFWSKITVGGANECWEWQAFRNRAGYGMVRNGHHMALAHRVAWVLEHGRVPPGKQVLHQCDNRACCNALHLYVGTNADNVRDKVERGRMPREVLATRGEKHWNARLTQQQVDEIRAQSTGRHGEGIELAERYGVSRATICNILKGKLWKQS